MPLNVKETVRLHKADISPFLDLSSPVHEALDKHRLAGIEKNYRYVS